MKRSTSSSWLNLSTFPQLFLLEKRNVDAHLPTSFYSSGTSLEVTARQGVS